MVGETIDKTFQTAKWSVRPLPKGMVEYGKIDSYILLKILRKLVEKYGFLLEYVGKYKVN